MQGVWENGEFILASTKDDKISKLKLENTRLREALEKFRGQLDRHKCSGTAEKTLDSIK
jgi:hypothetical protein